MTIPPSKSSTTLARILPKETLDLGRSFLSSLFMGVRTAQMHDRTNRAFGNAVQGVHKAALALHAATGGFSIKFVEETAFLNGARLSFNRGTFTAMRSLRHMLEERDLGGIEMVEAAPSLEGVERLLLMFAANQQDRATTSELAPFQIGVLGVQRFADSASGTKIDRRVLAVQCYAKLILVLTEQFEATETSEKPRLRAVRVIQDLIELCGYRADFILRLSTNHSGASPLVLHGVNVCLTSIALGHALGLERQELVDLGVAALFHHVGSSPASFSEKMEPLEVHTSVARIMTHAGLGISAHVRAYIAAEQNDAFGVPSQATGHPPHLFSRILSVAIGFDLLVSGLGGGAERAATVPKVGQRRHALDALAILHNNQKRRWDVRIVDLLVNILRAFPCGAEVLLDNNEVARVASHLGGSRWDRPIVITETDPPQTIELMNRDQHRFPIAILGTSMFFGRQVRSDIVMDEANCPAILDTEALIQSLDEEEPKRPITLPESVLIIGEDGLPHELPTPVVSPDGVFIMPPEEMPQPSESSPLVAPVTPGSFSEPSVTPVSPSASSPSEASSPSVAAPSASSPATPISSPAIPISSPAIPISSPAIPISSPAIPISSPAIPISSPSERPISSPSERPISSPDLPPFPAPDPEGGLPSFPGTHRKTDSVPPLPSAPPTNDLVIEDPVPLDPAFASHEIGPAHPTPPISSVPKPTQPMMAPHMMDLDNDPGFKPGDVIGGRYRVISTLGDGGMAVVYRAEHTLLLKQVAVKVLRPDMSIMRNVVARFQQEARSVCRLDNPHIVRVTDFGRAENDSLFLVMDLIEGPSLADRMVGGAPLPTSLAVEYADQILVALSHAHERDIIHRDLKPDNIMLVSADDAKPHIKLLDFGIAKLGADAMEDVGKITKAGMIFGTPSYMSPEQACGDPVDLRADLFAVGAILFEMLMGQPPFNGPNAAKILAATLTAPTPPLLLAESSPTMATVLESTVSCALSKDPSDRFENAQAFRDALQKCR